jgi:hypothetical protein
MATKGFFETFKPEDIVPLAMKKFDMDMARRKMDLIEQDHNMKLEATARDVRRVNQLRDMLLNTVHDKELATLPPVEGGEGETGMFSIPGELTKFGNDRITKAIKETSDPGAMITKALPFMNEAGINKVFEDWAKPNKTQPNEAMMLGGMVPGVDPKVYAENKRLTRPESKPAVPKYLDIINPATKETKRIDENTDKIPEGFVSLPVYSATKGPSEGSNLSDEQLIAIEKEVVKHPSITPEQAGIIRKEKEATNIRLARVKSENAQAVWSKEGFKTWRPIDKEQSFLEEMITGKKPAFAYRDTESKSLYEKESRQYQIDKGLTPGMVARMKADYKAEDKSLSNQRKSYDMMRGFVINLDKQIDAVDKRYKELPRTDMKLFNMPINKVRTYVTGSGEEAAVRAYLIEISNEAGKLSTNSAASIQELSQSAQAQWKKIHDEELSYNEMKKVLSATHTLGHDRIKSSEEAMNLTRTAIEQIAPGSVGSSSPSSPNVPSGGITVDPSKIKRGW